MVEAKWSGAYPCLCSGSWTLFVNGKNVTRHIPKDLKYSSMNTAGIYQSWHFEDQQEVFDDYMDGLECDEWITENKKWLNKITSDADIQKEIFYAIQKQDFRALSCGGCI